MSEFDKIKEEVEILKYYDKQPYFSQDTSAMMAFKSAISALEKQIKNNEFEMLILHNFISHMPKVYRERNMNYIVVRDILLSGTSTAGQTSCIAKCHELGINPYGYDLEISK